MFAFRFIYSSARLIYVKYFTIRDGRWKFKLTKKFACKDVFLKDQWYGCIIFLHKFKERSLRSYQVAFLLVLTYTSLVKLCQIHVHYFELPPLPQWAQWWWLLLKQWPAGGQNSSLVKGTRCMLHQQDACQLASLLE